MSPNVPSDNEPQHANIFYPLTPRLTTLLCTVITQGGAEDIPIFDLLNDDDAYMIREKAEQLLALDGDLRVSLVAKEMRRQFQFQGLAGLDSIDPTWLLAAVKGEQPLVIGIILAQLSHTTRTRILSQVPAEVRNRIPNKDELKQVPPEMMRVVRQLFEAKFETMPSPPGQPTNFYFRDVAMLEGRELVQLIRYLGLEQLGAAFLTVGRRKLAELCNAIDQKAAEELVAAVKETDPKDAMPLEEANEFLARILLGHTKENKNDPGAKQLFQRELFQKAGLYRLAKGIRNERPMFVTQIAQRLPRAHGRLLKSYVYRITEEPADEVKLRRLQDLILYRIEKLAGRGKINPRYLKFSFCYWGEEQEEPPPEE